MNRRCVVAAVALLAALASVDCARNRAPVERVVLVTIDTLRWDHVGYMGSDVATPNLDGLASSGTVFTETITSAPTTLPSHASILSGLYPPSHGVRNNGSFRLSDDVETITEVLSHSGYATGAFVGAFVLDRRFGLEQGFDHYDDDVPEENPKHRLFFPERRAEEVVERAVDWIRAQEDRRFFLWIHVFDPHAPYDPPPPYNERYPGRPYAGEVAYTDAALGPLFDAVTAIDNGEKTAVIVTADHGESLGEHGESSHALFIYDATMKVPLILTGPGIPSGTRVEQQVRTVDIAPTILELAGFKPKTKLDGVSLLGLLKRSEAPAPAAYGETLVPRLSFNWSELRFLRRDGFKLIDAPRRELYDLRADPEELLNLWTDSPPEVGQRLLSELEELAGRDDEALAPTVELDEDSIRRLESLGYIGTSVASSHETKDRPDPKDRVEVHEKLQRLLAADLPSDQIIEQYRAVLSLEPDNAMARFRLANTLAEQGRLEEAVAEFRELRRVSAVASEGVENLGAALLLLDRVEKALHVTLYAVKTTPWDIDLQVLRGEALEKAKRLDEAMESYGNAIELRPDDPRNYWRRGAVAQKLGDKERAERDFREAISKDASFQPAVAALARLLSEDGRAEEAIEILTSTRASPSPEGVETEPETPEMKAALAQAYLATGRQEEARNLLEEAKVEAPENTRVLSLLGSVYAVAGELEKAADMLRKALSLGETSPDVRRNLAVVYLRQRKLDAAIVELQAASRDVPEDASIWYTLGNAYLQAKQVDRAAGALEEALSLKPEWPEAAFNLALAYEQAGAPTKAAGAYRRFLAVAVGADAKRRAEAERRLAILERQPKK